MPKYNTKNMQEILKARKKAMAKAELTKKAKQGKQFDVSSSKPKLSPEARAKAIKTISNVDLAKVKSPQGKDAISKAQTYLNLKKSGDMGGNLPKKEQEWREALKKWKKRKQK